MASITLVSLTPYRAATGKLHSFPIGVTASFGVTLHDNVGRLFDVSSISLEHRVHRLANVDSLLQVGHSFGNQENQGKSRKV